MQPNRIIVTSNYPLGGCAQTADGSGRIRNPHLPGERHIYLRGYYPMAYWERKGEGGRSDRIEGSVLVHPSENLNEVFGHQQQQGTAHDVHLLDLSSDSVVLSGQLRSWSIISPGDVHIVFGIQNGVAVANAFDLIASLVKQPKPIQVTERPGHDG